MKGNMITETDRSEVIRRIAKAEADGNSLLVAVLRRVWADVLSEPERKPEVKVERIEGSPIVRIPL